MSLSDRAQLALELLQSDFDAVERDDRRAVRAGDRVSIDERLGYYWRTREFYDADRLEAATSDQDVREARMKTFDP